MVEIIYDLDFKKIVKKFKNTPLKDQIKNKIIKIIESPTVGKPMSHDKKTTREVYVGSYRLSYRYNRKENIITFADFYHKDEQ